MMIKATRAPINRVEVRKTAPSGEVRMMGTNSARVFDDALALPVDQRLALVDVLLGSLNAPIDPNIERLWEDEAERRVAQIDSGEATLVDGEGAFSRLHAKYRQ